MIVAAAAIITVGLAVADMRPSPGLDPWRGLLASEQRLLGRTSSLSQMTVADPADLTRDHGVNISWWPPGQQAVVYGLRRAGLSFGHSLKVLVVAAWLIGMAAWAACFSLSLKDTRMLPWLIAAFAFFRMSHTSAFVYTGGETILWAIFPAVAWLNLSALRASGAAAPWLALLAGAMSGGLVTIKYSGAILALGCGAAWIWNTVCRDAAMTRCLAWLTGAGLGGALAYAAISESLQGATPASPLVTPNIAAVLAWTGAGPIMAVADVNDALTTVMKALGSAGPTDGTVGWLALATGAIFLAWLIPSRAIVVSSVRNGAPARRFAWRLAVSVSLVTSIALAVLKLRGGIISWEGRHQQYSGFLLLPFLAEALIETIRTRRSWSRQAAVACLGLLIGLPVIYGAAALASKTLVRSAHLRDAFGSTGVPLRWSTRGEGAVAFARELSELPGFQSALLATPAQDIALTFPSHRLLLVMDRGDWWDRPYRGHPQGGVLLVSPPGVDESDTLIVRDMFQDIHQWRQVTLTSVPGTMVWRGQ
jgi:hypothetical protein